MNVKILNDFMAEFGHRKDIDKNFKQIIKENL